MGSLSTVFNVHPVLIWLFSPFYTFKNIQQNRSTSLFVVLLFFLNKSTKQSILCFIFLNFLYMYPLFSE